MTGIVGRLVKCASPNCGAKCLPPHTLCGRHRKPAPATRKAPTRQFSKDPAVEARRKARVADWHRDRMWRDL